MKTRLAANRAARQVAQRGNTRPSRAACLATLLLASSLAIVTHAGAAEALPVIEVEDQPLAANAQRVVEAFDFLGAPLANEVQTGVRAAALARDASKLQGLLDPRVFGPAR